MRPVAAAIEIHVAVGLANAAIEIHYAEMGHYTEICRSESEFKFHKIPTHRSSTYSVGYVHCIYTP